MKRKHLAASLGVIACVATAPSAALAYTKAQASSDAVSWLHNHCGQGRVCESFALTSLTGTGINQKGRAQWKFVGRMTEFSNKGLDAGTYYACTAGGGIDPYGTVLNAYKLCSPEGAMIR